jgi:hypothetical protein
MRSSPPAPRMAAPRIDRAGDIGHRHAADQDTTA